MVTPGVGVGVTGAAEFAGVAAVKDSSALTVALPGVTSTGIQPWLLLNTSTQAWAWLSWISAQ